MWSTGHLLGNTNQKHTTNKWKLVNRKQENPADSLSSVYCNRDLRDPPAGWKTRPSGLVLITSLTYSLCVNGNQWASGWTYGSTHPRYAARRCGCHEAPRGLSRRRRHSNLTASGYVSQFRSDLPVFCTSQASGYSNPMGACRRAARKSDSTHPHNQIYALTAYVECCIWSASRPEENDSTRDISDCATSGALATHRSELPGCAVCTLLRQK